MTEQKILTPEETVREGEILASRSTYDKARKALWPLTAVFMAAMGGAVVYVAATPDEEIPTAVPIALFTGAIGVAGCAYAFAHFGTARERSVKNGELDFMAFVEKKRVAFTTDKERADAMEKYKEWLDAGCPTTEKRETPVIPTIIKKPFAPNAQGGAA